MPLHQTHDHEDDSADGGCSEPCQLAFGVNRDNSRVTSFSWELPTNSRHHESGTLIRGRAPIVIDVKCFQTQHLEGSAVFERSAVFENGDTGGSTGGSADPALFVKGHQVAFTESLQMYQPSNIQFPLPVICSRT